MQHFFAGFLHQLGAWVVVLVNAVTKTHQLDGGVLVFDLLDELTDVFDTTIFLNVGQHVQGRFVGAAVGRTPEAGHASSNRCKRVGARRAAQAHGGGRGVLLVVSVQDKNTVERAFEHRIDLVLLAGCGKHRVQKVTGVAQVVAWVDIRLTDGVFVGHGHQRWHLGNQANRCNFAVLRIVDVGAVMVEGRQGADQTGHDGHRMGVTAEAAHEKLHLLVHHGVVGHAPDEICFLVGVRQLAVQQQVASFEVVAVGGELLDRVAAVQQFAFVAVDVGDGRLGCCGRQKAGVVSEHAGLGVQLANVHHVRADRALVNRHLNAGRAVAEREGGFVVG